MRTDEEVVALAILRNPIFVLAQQVLGGGPHASVRAVELAASVIDPADARVVPACDDP